MLAEEKLRKVSDAIFQEAEPPKDRSKPLEWRRRLNLIDLRLKNPKLITSYEIHETNYELERDQKNEFAHGLKPNLKGQLAIDGLVDEEQMRDRLYLTVEDKDDKTLFSTARVPSPLKVRIRSGEPTDATERRPTGLYWGNAFKLDFAPDDEGFQFEVSVPREQLISLIAAMRADEGAVVDLQLWLLSFTYEVDDFFREPWHPQDIVLNDGAPCFARWVGVSSKIGVHTVSVASEPPDQEADIREKREVTPEQQAHAELVRAILSYAGPLTRAGTALWVVAIVAILWLLFK